MIQTKLLLAMRLLIVLTTVTATPNLSGQRKPLLSASRIVLFGGHVSSGGKSGTERKEARAPGSRWPAPRSTVRGAQAAGGVFGFPVEP